MLKKNKLFFSLLSLILVITLSFGFNFPASAETVEQYKVTGNLWYNVINAGGYDSISGEYEILDGYIDRTSSSIIFSCYHENVGDIYLQFIREDQNWFLSTFNHEEYMFNLNQYEPIFYKKMIRLQRYYPNRTLIVVDFRNIELEPVSDTHTSTIPNGQYKGTGTASVETVFGTFNLGNLAKTKINAVVTDNQLDLSFQAKNIPYQIQANLDSIDSDEMATYTYSDQNESWQITVTSDGKLDGSLAYTGDRGTMNFSMQLQTK